MHIERQREKVLHKVPCQSQRATCGRLGSRLPSSRGFQRLNSGRQARQQAPVPAGPPGQLPYFELESLNR